MSPSPLSGLIMTTQDTLPLAARPTDPMKHDNLLINFTMDFRRIWDTSGTNTTPAAFWRPTPAPDLLPGYFPLGDVIASGFDNINEIRMVPVVSEGESSNGQEPALQAPIDFEQVWSDARPGATATRSIWRPIAPSGYVALGQLCSNGQDKPLTSDIRCVRKDLAIRSFIDDLIWNDKGSRATQYFSAYNFYPPVAMPGEINCLPGTFIGVGTHARPAAHINAYSLRIPIPLEIKSPPQVPVLSDQQPMLFEPGKVTQIAKLPWFVVRDPNLTPLKQLRTSPFYFLERTDQYVLVGYGKNESAVSQTFRWTARRPQRSGHLGVFARISSIVIHIQWPIGIPTLFSARLNKSFAHAESDGWAGPADVEVACIIGKNKAVAAYELQSTYSLWRENRTQVPCELYYIDGNSLHLTEYPLEPASEGNPLSESETPETVDNTASGDDMSIPPAS
jgi:hypothetical protein